MRKAEGKRPSERPRHRWKNNITLGLTATGKEGMDWFNLAQHREKWRAVVNRAMVL
jgi:hypothetical protein